MAGNDGAQFRISPPGIYRWGDDATFRSYELRFELNCSRSIQESGYSEGCELIH